MLHRQKISRIVLAAFSLLFLAQCGKEGKSSLVSFSIKPEKPIVITADTKRGDDDIKGPWFTFRMDAANDSEDTVTIVALQLKITIVDEFGAEQTSESSFTPGEEDTTVTVADTDFQCTYAYFAEIPPGGKASLAWLNANNPLNVDECPQYAGFLVHGLPKVPNQFRYTIEAKPIGWFGTYAEPTDRFERLITFFTQ